MSAPSTLYKALGIHASTHPSFIDINLSRDTRLFIDPMNILRNSDPLSLEAKEIIQNYFALLIEHISKGDETKALHLLSGLTERNTISSFTRLGYSKNRNGKAIGPDKAKLLYDAIRTNGAEDLGGIEELTFMIIGIDKDNVSDLITNLIGHLLADYSLKECLSYGGKTKVKKSVLMWSPSKMDWIKRDIETPYLENEYVVFVPKDLVTKVFLLSIERLLTHVLVPYKQEQLFSAGSALCRLLKDGTRGLPLVKDVRKLIEHTKSEVITFVKGNPELLEKYKESLIIK